MWCAITGALTFPTLPTFATDMYAQFQTHLLPPLSTLVSLNECHVVYYDGAGNPDGSSSSVHNGSAAGDSLGANSAIVTSWKIPATWRGGKPRSYLPGIPVTGLYDIRLLGDAFIGTVQTAALAFLNGVNALTLSGVTQVRLGTVSFQHANAWRTPPVFFEYVGVGVQKRICSQRRRLGSEVF
jgi:hypothetical protein